MKSIFGHSKSTALIFRTLKKKIHLVTISFTVGISLRSVFPYMQFFLLLLFICRKDDKNVPRENWEEEEEEEGRVDRTPASSILLAWTPWAVLLVTYTEGRPEFSPKFRIHSVYVKEELQIIKKKHQILPTVESRCPNKEVSASGFFCTKLYISAYH
jgi:hypothetical protein